MAARIPAGAVAHLRTVGRQDHPKRQPRAVVIGVPRDVQAAFGAEYGVYQTRDQLIRFVDDETQAQTVIAGWLAET